MAELESRWAKFTKAQQELEENTKRAKDAINKSYNQLEDQISKLRAQEKELKELKDLVQRNGTNEMKALVKEFSLQLKKLNESMVPSTGSLFVRLFLGQVNVRQYRDGERFRLKQEYQKFKSKTDPLFLLFVVVQLFIARNRGIEILFQVWLLYYYTTLALRECILQVNGSNIRSWWILHHYISMVISITILSWPPDCETYLHFLPQFLYFSLFQGLVQVLQNTYQSAKLYKLIAMGKADRMDVTSESSVFFDLGCSPGLTFLLPFLLFVQGFQVYNAYTLLLFALQAQVVEWQVIACGICFMILGFGNLGTTLATYRQKIKEA